MNYYKHKKPFCAIIIDLTDISPAEFELISETNNERDQYTFYYWSNKIGYVSRVPELLEKRIRTDFNKIEKVENE